MTACISFFQAGFFQSAFFQTEQRDFVEPQIDRLATQYREATKFIGILKAQLEEIQDVARILCGLPGYFDLDGSVGEQLSFIGKRMGWPRRHCVCVTLPVLGFEYADPPAGIQIPIAGNCEDATFLACGATGAGEVELTDDETYRRFLRVRRYQMRRLYDISSLQNAAQVMWGATARIHDGQPGTVVIAFGRALSDYEAAILPLALRVLPIAPGIRPLVHFGFGPILGFGQGWAGNCEGGEVLCPEFIDPYGCAA